MGDSMQSHTLAAVWGQSVKPGRGQPEWGTSMWSVCTPPRVPSHQGPHRVTTDGGSQIPHEEVTPQHPVPRGKLKAAFSILPVSAAASLSPRCSCLMAPMAVALILGWWLVAASRAQQLPRPSLSLHPSQGVSLGDNVTLRCHLPQPAAWVWLFQDGYLRSYRNMDKRRDMAEFFLVHLKQEDAVKYWCQYDTVAPWGTSNKSDPVQLVVTDPSYAPPAISLNPEECVDVGMNVTIQCWSQEHGGTIFLHKDGHSAPIQHQDPDDGGSATFTLFGVNPADSGTYRCSYRVGGSYLLSSPLGDNVTLEVIPRPAPPGDNGIASRALVAEVAGGCAAAIVIIIVLTVSFLLVAQRRRMQRDERPGATSRNPEAVQFQVSVPR
eukprot:XP_025001882.1 platelet glycoprotein VI-like [Gallus gallus]